MVIVCTVNKLEAKSSCSWKKPGGRGKREEIINIIIINTVF